eukprot:jgi/Ulvmu1/7966/UM004_0199.1
MNVRRGMDFNAYWPSWPDGKSSTLVLVDTDSTTVDELFGLLFGTDSTFQASARETRGFTNYSESEWVTTPNELPCLPGGFSWTCAAPCKSHALRGTDFQSRMRKVCFQSGRSLRTEELHRCILAAPGQQYVVDCTVAVTAPFGDRFRTICRYTMAAVTPAAAQLRIDYAMTYAKPIPRWGRAMLEPAAESGLAKNFAQFIAVLSSFIHLSDATVPVSPRRIRTVRTMFVDDHVVDLFLPLAEVLLMSAGLSNSGDVAVRGAAALLSTTSVLLLLQILLNLWHRVGQACEGSRSVPGALCAQAHRVVDLPQSVAGLFVATVAIMSLRSLMGGVAAQMAQHSSRRLQEQPTPRSGSDSPASDTGAAGDPTEAVRSHEIAPSCEAEERPNVHMQRLGAVGNFLIFRWDRLGPRRDRLGPRRDRWRPQASSGADSQAEASADATGEQDRGGHVGGAASRDGPDGRVSGRAGKQQGAARLRGAYSEELLPAFHPAGAVVVEDVYENQRWQPFRGWGHSWPGHFLPTDSLRQWSDGGGRAAQHGSRLEDAAPRLPPGRTWVGEWHVDVSGYQDALCDPHGWFYSFNFQTLPFSGRTVGRHPMPCVRRRRWIRAHVPEPWSPACPALLAALQPQHSVAGSAQHQTAALVDAATKACSKSAPCDAARPLPSVHSTGTLLAARTVHPGDVLPAVDVPGAALCSRASVPPSAGLRKAAGPRAEAGAGAGGAGENTCSPGASDGITVSPCSPRSPHAKLDLRSMATSEELLGVAGADANGGQRSGHRRSSSAPQVLHRSSHSGGQGSERRWSLGDDSVSGPLEVPAGEPLGWKLCSFPLATAARATVIDEGDGGSLNVAKNAQDSIDELLRSWSERFYGAA